MKTYKFTFKPWAGGDSDIFLQPIRAFNQAGAWEKAKDLSKEIQCSVLGLILVS